MTEFHIPLKHLNIIVKNAIMLNKNETLHKCMETFYKEGISMIPIMALAPQATTKILMRPTTRRQHLRRRECFLSFIFKRYNILF